MKPELKKILKARAHALKPVVITGQNGLSDAVMNEIDLALEHHELIKVRINASDREERSMMIGEICQRLSAEMIQSIGHIIAIYRKASRSRRTTAQD